MKKANFISWIMILHLLQLFCSLVMTTTSGSPSPSVIIIGAGMSGISAAKTLDEAGISDFIILEATPRIGGRIHKVEFGGYTVELGANWLVGAGGRRKNPVFEVAKKVKLKTFFWDSTNMSSNIYKQRGGLYAKDEADAVIKVAEATKQFGEIFSNQIKSDDISISALFRLYNKREPMSPLEMVIDYFYYDLEDGEPPRVTSLKHTLPRHEYEDFGQNSYFAADPRGIESIVHHLANKFLLNQGDPRLKLNKVVDEINYSGNGVSVKTEDGSQYEARMAIVSVSLGVLQSDLIKFKPKLPGWKERSIQEFSMTTFTKIFLKFPHKFWPTGNGTSIFLYADKRRGYYSTWQHLDVELPESNIIFVLVTDEESMRIEQQSDEETKNEAMEVLRKMFGDDIPDAEDILVPRWKTNKFYGGTYSNWPFGYSHHRHKQLQEPVGAVYFTGEHTNPRYLGYMDGAYYAGQHTAKDAIRCLRENICADDNYLSETYTV